MDHRKADVFRELELSVNKEIFVQGHSFLLQFLSEFTVKVKFGIGVMGAIAIWVLKNFQEFIPLFIDVQVLFFELINFLLVVLVKSLQCCVVTCLFLIVGLTSVWVNICWVVDQFPDCWVSLLDYDFFRAVVNFITFGHLLSEHVSEESGLGLVGQ